MIQQVILDSCITSWNIKVTFSNVEEQEGKNGSHLVSWIAPGYPYLDRAERRKRRSVTKGRARCDGKEENEKERLPFFLLPITQALPLTAFLSRRLRDDKQGRVSLLPHSLTRHLHISHNAPCFPPPPPQILHDLFSSFLLGIAAVPREFENNTYANFWEANKVHCGRCASGV